MNAAAKCRARVDFGNQLKPAQEFNPHHTHKVKPMKTVLAIVALSFATAASAQSTWPFQPYQERSRELPQPIRNACADLAVTGIQQQQMVERCFAVDIKVPQPTPDAARTLRRI